MKQIKCPVKLLYGTRDKYFPLEDALEIKEAIGSYCSITGIPMCSHYGHVEYPHAIAYHILKFYDEVESNKNMTKY